MEVLKKGSKGESVKELQGYLHLYQDGVFGSVTEGAVRVFQAENGLTADGVVGAKTWEKLKMCNGTDLKKASRKITKIILHCTATVEGKDCTVEEIRKWHIGQGWSDIGYHYVIYRDGSVHDGRNINQVGSHCSGQNTGSIGVVYVGGLSKDGKTAKDTRTEAQKKSIIELLKKLLKIYKLKPKDVYGHYQFANKACPSFKIDGLRKEI